MLLTKECDYGIRIIRALSDGSKKTVDVIASEEQVPPKYAYKIIKKLADSGFVCSTRGRIGGYHLQKPLDTFTILDIIQSIDTSRYVNECLRADSVCPFKDSSEKECSVHKELTRLQALIVSELSIKTMDIIFEKNNS